MKKKRKQAFYRMEKKLRCAMCGLEVELNEARVVKSVDGHATVHWFCEQDFASFVRALSKEVRDDESGREN